MADVEMAVGPELDLSLLREMNLETSRQLLDLFQRSALQHMQHMQQALANGDMHTLQQEAQQRGYSGLLMERDHRLPGRPR